MFALRPWSGQGILPKSTVPPSRAAEPLSARRVVQKLQRVPAMPLLKSCHILPLCHYEHSFKSTECPTGRTALHPDCVATQLLAVIVIHWHKYPFRKPGSLYHVAKRARDLPRSKRKASAQTSTMGRAFVRQTGARSVYDSIVWKISIAARTSGWLAVGTMSGLSGRMASIDFKRLEALWWPLIACPFTLHSSVVCHTAEGQPAGDSN